MSPISLRQNERRTVRDQLPIIRSNSVKRPIRSNTRKHKNHFKEHSKGFLFALVIFSLLLVRLFVRLEILELSYVLEEARAELLVQDSKLRELRATKAMTGNNRQVASEATKKLGLKETIPQQIRLISRSS